MFCKAAPYEGDKPYIFLSYCHQNADVVYPVIERLARDGYRVWYDDGIHPGDNWVETIASHIHNAKYCVAIVTPESVESHNCRNEINFVIENKINFVPVIWTDFPMSLGVRMQLASSHFIKRYEMAGEDAFIAKLYAVQGLQECKGEVSLLKEVEVFPEEEEEPVVIPVLDTVPESEPEPEPEEEEQDQDWDADFWDDEDEATEIEEKTIRVRKSAKKNIVNPDVLEVPAIWAYLAGQTIYELKKNNTKIGRDASSCDIVLKDRTISSLHATVLYNSQNFYLRDEDSSNGTTVNGTLLEGLQPVQMNPCAVVSLADEVCVFAANEAANWIKQEKKCAVLHCEETGESKVLVFEELRLGRSYAWAEGTFTDKRASRMHGRIVFEKGKYYLVTVNKETTNGTFLNGALLGPGEKKALKDGDVIRFGSVYQIVFQWIPLTLKGE